MCGMVVSRLGVWKGGAMPAEAPRECVKEVMMLRRVRERGRGDRGRKSCERAGRLERGDADDGYTGTVDVKCYNFFAADFHDPYFLSLCLPLFFVRAAQRAGS